jgi:hypothetical protein
MFKTYMLEHLYTQLKIMNFNTVYSNSNLLAAQWQFHNIHEAVVNLFTDLTMLKLCDLLDYDTV